MGESIEIWGINLFVLIALAVLFIMSVWQWCLIIILNSKLKKINVRQQQSLRNDSNRQSSGGVVVCRKCNAIFDSAQTVCHRCGTAR